MLITSFLILVIHGFYSVMDATWNYNTCYKKYLLYKYSKKYTKRYELIMATWVNVIRYFHHCQV